MQSLSINSISISIKYVKKTLSTFRSLLAYRFVVEHRAAGN